MAREEAPGDAEERWTAGDGRWALAANRLVYVG